MSIVNLIVIIVAAVLGLWGFIKGFVKELFSLVSWILSIIIAIFLVKPLNPYISNWLSINNNVAANAITFVGIFIISFLIIRIIAQILSKKTSKSAFGFVNRLLGLVWGLTKALLIFSILFLLVDYLETVAVIGDKISDFLTNDFLKTKSINIALYIYEHNPSYYIIDLFKAS